MHHKNSAGPVGNRHTLANAIHTGLVLRQTRFIADFWCLIAQRDWKRIFTDPREKCVPAIVTALCESVRTVPSEHQTNPDGNIGACIFKKKNLYYIMFHPHIWHYLSPVADSGVLAGLSASAWQIYIEKCQKIPKRFIRSKVTVQSAKIFFRKTCMLPNGPQGWNII